MWNYEKRLQYPINIKTPNAKAALFIMSQYGGPDGEIAASMRYLSQRFAMPNRIAMGTLNDIGISLPLCPLLHFHQHVIIHIFLNKTHIQDFCSIIFPFATGLYPHFYPKRQIFQPYTNNLSRIHDSFIKYFSVKDIFLLLKTQDIIDRFYVFFRTLTFFLLNFLLLFYF